MAEATKHEIRVQVKTQYVPEQSDPENGRHVFAYTINITNLGNVPAQLISRHWVITDADGKVQEVRGLADTHPRIPEDPFAAQNRRITFMLPFSNTSASTSSAPVAPPTPASRPARPATG